MSLDDLLKPIKWADEQVLREYTKIGRKIPENSLYKLTAGLTIASFSGMFGCGIEKMLFCQFFMEILLDRTSS